MIQGSQFSFFWKGSETNFYTTWFAHDFSRKIILILHSINWPHFIVWLSLLLKILGNICIKIVCYSACDVIKYQINLIFLIKPFRYMTKNSRQNLKYLENEKSFWAEIKLIFHFFKGISDAKNYVRPESAPLKSLWNKIV